MPLRHIWLVMLACYAASVFGAEVRLGPETPLDHRLETSPAAGRQYILGAASNGRDFLVLWGDEDPGTPARVTRVGTDGRPVTPFGKAISSNPRAHSGLLASDGTEYLVVWTEDAATYAQRLDENGNGILPRVSLKSWSFPRALVSNGRTFLLTNVSGPAMILDRDGSKVRDITTFGDVIWAGAQGRNYRLVERESGPVIASASGTSPCGMLVLRTFDESGAGSNIPLSLPWACAQEAGVLAASDDRILLVDTRTKGFAVVDVNGNVTLGNEPVCPGPSQSAFEGGWDGVQFLAVCSTAQGIFASRITRSGRNLDSTPFVLSASPVNAYTRVEFASNGASQLVVWGPDSRHHRLGDVVALAGRTFDEIVAASGTGTLVSLSGPAQLGVQIAAMSDRLVAVWEDDASIRVGGVTGGSFFSIAQPVSSWFIDPKVVAGERTFLVYWRAGVFTWPQVGSRFTPVGEMLDPKPILLCSHAFSMGATHDGTDFIVACSQPVTVLRLSEEGKLTELRRIAETRGFVRPLSTANGVLLHSGNAYQVISPFVMWIVNALVEKLEAVGQRRTFFQTAGTSVVAAAGPDRVMLLFPNSLALAQTSLDGLPLRDLYRPLPVNGPGFGDIVWNGSEYVVAWIESSQVRAVRLDRSGNLIDAVPFVVCPAAATNHPPSLAATDGGVTIAYSRYDEVHGGAPRAFTRTLERLPRGIKRRSVH